MSNRQEHAKTEDRKKRSEAQIFSAKTRSHTGFQRHEFKHKAREHALIEAQRADAAILLPADQSVHKPEKSSRLTEGEENYDVPLFKQSQKSIGKQVDIVSSAKQFDLSLKDFGPYSVDYTRNGRHLLLYGRLGHVAVFDWLTKRLTCEFHVQESINAAVWLHQETMYAVAQRQWTHIYDQQGTELHCVKKLDQVQSMTFLPQHFLLCCGNERGFLSYLDVSTGALVSQLPTKLGRISLLTHNPSNAVVNIAHPNGRISMWTPNTSAPIVQLQAHRCALSAVDIDQSGTYMLSSGTDRIIKLWDLRQYRVLREYRMSAGVTALAFSQQRKFAAAMVDCVQVMNDVALTSRQAVDEPLHLQHRTNGYVKSLKFCPYDDVLGVGTRFGFCSMLVPGSGEPNFDSFVADPFQTKRQRQELEVRLLLDKLPANMISLDAEEIGKVNEATLAEKLKAREEILHVRIPKIAFTPRFRPAGPSSGSVKAVKRKRGVKNERQRAALTEALSKRNKLLEAESNMVDSAEHDAKPGSDAVNNRMHSVLSRFIPRQQK